jgi:hypothetical protein
VHSVTLVENTAVPVLKITAAPVPAAFGGSAGLIKVDICVAGPSHRGSEARTFVQRLIAIHPQVL